MFFKGLYHLKSMVCWLVLLCFTFSTVGYAQTPSSLIGLSSMSTPPLLKGIRIHSEDPFKFDFIINKGDENLSLDKKRSAYVRLIKYFLASLAVPDEDQWVNLSPYEKDRIIKEDFGRTEMGRDLLTQDYLLKQITASLMFPESGTGKAFWTRVYREAFEKYGTTDVPVDSFNKVWITPDEAVIYEKENAAYIGKSHLKVQLESDYLAEQEHLSVDNIDRSTASTEVKQVIREVILPELEKEVNDGANFALLRQIFSGMILAAWYKASLKQTLLGRVYVDKSKVKGVEQQDVAENQRIYARYVETFKTGVYNYIKEEDDPSTETAVSRKYFSGGIQHPDSTALTTLPVADFNGIVLKSDEIVRTTLDPARDWLTRKYLVLSFSNIMDIFGSIRTVFSIVQKKISRNISPLFLVASLSISIIGCSKPDEPVVEPPEPPTTEIPASSKINIQKAHQWLMGTINSSTGLVKTFPNLQSGYDHGVGWTFTQGQVIVAFLAADDIGSAQRVAKGLLDRQGPNGSWYNAYMAETGAVAPEYEHKKIWVGPNVVAGRSLLQVYQRTSDAVLQARILEAVNRLTVWLQTFFVDGQQYGFLKGGEGVVWTSTEQNLRAMALFDQYADILNGLGRAQEASNFKEMADKIAFWVENKMWAGDHYYVGYTSGESVDYNLNEAGDVQFLVPVMAGKRLSQFPHAKEAVEHWLATYEKTVYWNGKKLVGIARWVDTNSIWSEGMGDAIAAMKVLGINYDKMKLYFETLRDMQNINGGIPAALSDVQTTWPGHVPELSVEASSALVAVIGKIGLLARLIPTPDGMILVLSDPVDNSMAKDPDLGGIDFDAAKLNLQIKRDGQGVALPVDQQDVENIHIDGLVPMILDIQPVDLQLLKF